MFKEKTKVADIGASLEFCSHRSFKMNPIDAPLGATMAKTLLICSFTGLVIACNGVSDNLHDIQLEGTPALPLATNLQWDPPADHREVPAINLQAEKNKQIIREMDSYQENWNGYGAKSFSREQLRVFNDVIQNLDFQPDIMPTARNSLLMQYVYPNNTQLMFELFEDYMEEVLVPTGNYGKAQVKTYESDFASRINDEIRIARGSQYDC